MTSTRASVLFVEDDEDIRESLLEALRDEGFDVAGAADGIEALALLRAAEVKPAVIFLDLMMPRMNGEDFRAAQQADAGLAGIPVVLLSADAQVREKCRAMNAADCLSKPVKLADVVAMALRFARG